MGLGDDVYISLQDEGDVELSEKTILAYFSYVHKNTSIIYVTSTIEKSGININLPVELASEEPTRTEIGFIYDKPKDWFMYYIEKVCKHYVSIFLK